MVETPRYVVMLNVSLTKPAITQYRIEDTKEYRNICYCTFIADAQNIAKAMNIDNSWEPITHYKRNESLK